jgi:GAF domain-containing protein
VRVDLAERLLASLGAIDDEPPSLTTICQTCCDVLGVNGVSLVLMSATGSQAVASAFDGRARSVQDQEFILGEGPSLDAYDKGQPVLVGDVYTERVRWPHFVSAAAEMGVRAVYAVPLQVGPTKLGMIVLHWDEPKSPTAQDLSDALVAASLVSQLVLVLQSDATSESLAWALDLTDSRAVVHQATGMISAQLDRSVAEALVRLRAHAFAAGIPIGEVADQVVNGQLRFD